ncbi:chorismate mutase [Vagococcus fluvialis]|uniref:Chorismate mutase n=1 Tax=Vagococcus fluvialis TaxID=2738 RepID=A0A7X6DAA2_9ENTE|nr:chorismate mutase [Vagococcus fluvialis]NKC68388.1 chorismate mutase [Vagococcus fluvialis]
MLEKPRAEINKIDAEIVALLEKRYLSVDEVVRIKKENNLPTLDSKREEEVIARLQEMIAEKEYEEAILKTFQSMMDISKEYQKSKR